jgi:hypothetical protein
VNGKTFETMRVWAMLTGLAMAGWLLGELSMGATMSETVAMLLAGIGGFELFLFGQDQWLARKGTHG